jgi:hypothetical protein
MVNGPSDISTKYVNPTSIPRGAGRTVSSDSPMNNASNLFNDPSIVVVDESSLASEDGEILEENGLIFYDNDIEMLQDESSIIPDNLSSTGLSHLSSPSNLSILLNSFQIESNSSINGDGTITYSATLTFDDIIGATGYEYLINAGA